MTDTPYLRPGLAKPKPAADGLDDPAEVLGAFVVWSEWRQALKGRPW